MHPHHRSSNSTKGSPIRPPRPNRWVRDWRNSRTCPSAVVERQPIADLGLGTAATGQTTLAAVGDRQMRLDVIRFRHNSLGVFLIAMYDAAEPPPLNTQALAQLLDRRAVDAFKPDPIGNYLNRGRLNVRARKYDEAIADFDRAIALAPEDAIA